MEVRVTAEALDPWSEVITYQHAQTELAGKFGATSVFVGTMRDINLDTAVTAMHLEHYPGMTEKHLMRVSEEAAAKWHIIDSLVVHRVGALTPNDPIVVVAVWAVHREDAFKACRYIIDELKTRAPLWKQETTPRGDRWVAPET